MSEIVLIPGRRLSPKDHEKFEWNFNRDREVGRIMVSAVVHDFPDEDIFPTEQANRGGRERRLAHQAVLLGAAVTAATGLGHQGIGQRVQTMERPDGLVIASLLTHTPGMPTDEITAESLEAIHLGAVVRANQHLTTMQQPYRFTWPLTNPEH
jgi:hypothetical protein